MVKVSLKILHIVICIPEAPFHIREKGKVLRPAGMIGNLKLRDFTGIVYRHKGKNRSFNIILCGMKAAVTDAVAAFIAVELGVGRLPAGIPDLGSIFYIEILPVVIIGNIVVTVSGETEQFCIFIETVAAACIGNQRKEVRVSEVVDPGKRCSGGRNDIFPMIIIEISKFHVCILHIKLFTCDIVDESGKKHLVE